MSTRVSEIHMNSHPGEWQYCSSELNVANDLSRGLTSEQLATGRWRCGPNYLRSAEEDWPSMNATENEADVVAIEKEKKTTEVVSVIKVKSLPVLEEMKSSQT